MDISSVLTFAADHISTILVWVFVGSGIIQFAPIKFNPWSYIAKKIGKAINGEVITKVDKIETTVSDLKKEVGEIQAVDIRVRILKFNEELLHSVRHSKDSFNQVLEDIDNYEKYCDTHPGFKNNRAVLAINNIKDAYKKCMQDRDFL